MDKWINLKQYQVYGRFKLKHSMPAAEEVKW